MLLPIKQFDRYENPFCDFVTEVLVMVISDAVFSLNGFLRKILVTLCAIFMEAGAFEMDKVSTLHQ